MISIRKEFDWEAGHWLPQHDGKCNREHGHSYRLVVDVTGTIQPQFDRSTFNNPEWGMIIDFGKMKDVVKKVVVDKYDHRLMQDFFENPTAEIMLHKFVEDIDASFSRQHFSVTVSYAELWETRNSCAVYRKD